MSARRSIAASAAALALLMAGGPAASAQTNASLFALICASSIGFSQLESTACGQSAVVGNGDPTSEPRKQPPGIDMLVAEALAGNTIAGHVLAATFTNGVALPLVRLNTDPCDAFRSSGGAGCTTTPAAGRSGVFGSTSASLNETLTDEQEALLGCGPFWGTDCEQDGIDLTNAESSVLLQSFPGFRGQTLPGARGPEDPGYDATVDGCPAPDTTPQCALAKPLATATNPFQSEMAALSWNFLMTLVAFSQVPTGEVPENDEFDPLEPTRTGDGQCSFAQPQYCSAVISFLQVPEPGSMAAGAVALLALRARRLTRR